jgi:hypothetical protein
VVHDERLLWPDTIVIREGWLYVSADRLNRQAKFNGGDQQQRTPFGIFRVWIGQEPVIR